MNSVISKGVDGKTRRLIFNHAFLLVNKSDELSMDVEYKEIDLTFTLNVQFSDDGDPYNGDVIVSDDGKIMDLILYKWENALGVENKDPYVISTKDGTHNLYFKYRTLSDNSHGGRFFIVSIWCEQIK